MAADGIELQGRGWPVQAPPARGHILIVHGLGEHIGRYAHVAAALTRQGWTVQGYDQRGHGRSGGGRGALTIADGLLQDLAACIDHIRAISQLPLVLLGHSMGGLVVGRFVAEGLAPSPAAWWRPVDALVMSSPALDLGMNAYQKGLLAVLERMSPNLAVGNGLDPAWVSRDAAVVAAYKADPLVHNRVTPRLVRFIVDAGAVVRAAAARWSVPTLLMYAGADRCVAPSGSAEFAAKASQAQVQSICFETLFHEIFNEPEQADVLRELTQWLASHVPAAGLTPA